MPRLNRPTRDPEIVALSVIALRSYAQGTPAQAEFEAEISKSLKDLNVSPQMAARLVANFDKIRPAIRLRELGPLGLSNARPPAAVARGSKTSSAQARRDVLRPGLVAAGRGQVAAGRGQVAAGGGQVAAGGGQVPAAGEQFPAEEQVLAPERFTISYQGMHCVDETGIDFTGSDEIYILTSAVHIKRDGTNHVRTERHPTDGNGAGTYDDVDSHETRIGPVAACWSGLVDDVQEGMSLTTVVMEHDQGDPDAYRDEVDAAVKLAIAGTTYFFPPGGALLALIEASGLVTDIFNWMLQTDDDEVGTVSLVLGSLSELETYSRTRLSSLNVVQDGQQVNTQLRNHFLAPVSAGDYIVGYRVTRVPEAPLFPIVVN